MLGQTRTVVQRVWASVQVYGKVEYACKFVESFLTKKYVVVDM